MESQRQQKISKLLQKDLGEIFQMEVPHLTRGAMVSVTKVHITPDLSSAKVYLSLFASKNRPEVMQKITRNSSEIRGKLGNRVRHQLRVVPELHFYEDDSLDYIENIESLLKD